MKLAIVEKTESKYNWKQHFKCEYDSYKLTDSTAKTIKKADINIEINVDDYDFIITVGAEPTKYFQKQASVVTHQGLLLADKYLPIVNPNMVKLKPEAEPSFKRAITEINGYLTGTSKEKSKLIIHKISETANAVEYLRRCLDVEIIATDTETSALYCRKGYTLGISIALSPYESAYIDANCLDDECEMLLHLLSLKENIFHNAKFDKHFLKHDFSLVYNKFHDTMLLHYALDENSEHGLKPLAIKYTDLGDYDRELEVFKSEYCRKHKVKVKDFTYDLIPFDILAPYAAIDTIATFRLFELFYPKVVANERLNKLYNKLLLEGTDFLVDMENNGIPINRAYLYELKDILAAELFDLEVQLYEHKEIKEFEAETGVKLNPNSPVQVRTFLYDFLKLPVYDKRTDTGELSVDVEVLEELANCHPIPALLLKIKKNLKIKGTYVDKIFLHLDTDDRLRTGFGIHTTTSGRLSSSGTLNAQTMPRDDKRVKKSIAAGSGYKIVSQDLIISPLRW